ncbi:TIGR02996 domain-containing protein [Gemmata sp. JC717]|uniref:TIGR02996 domain-containing protein n=1 Tax=Gemmata algarum TaxID=2975278 RepID=UPI0021BAD649|nr:TIGR02996 domain-containing protein [Gemmata algarum]MDY3556732.1 TIGR02996 domain-containing protein [Gemmata algarum]
MRKHPDADAFVREHLRHPAHATTRLAFADWLDETGTPSNAAWAHYIRLREEADRHAPDSEEQQRLLRQADRFATKVSAKLTLAARVFARDPELILQLIPAANVTFRLETFEPPRSILGLVPESVAIEKNLLPLALHGNTLFLVTDRANHDAANVLGCILNKEVILVSTDRLGLSSIASAFGHTEETFDSVFREYSYLPLLPNDPPTLNEEADPRSAAVRFVNMLFREAIERRADRIHISPEPTGMHVTYVADVWVQYGWVPPRFQFPALARIALMARIPVEWTHPHPTTLIPIMGEFQLQVAGIQFCVRVTMTPSPDGPTTQIDLNRESLPST